MIESARVFSMTLSSGCKDLLMLSSALLFFSQYLESNKVANATRLISSPTAALPRCESLGYGSGSRTASKSALAMDSV